MRCSSTSLVSTISAVSYSSAREASMLTFMSASMPLTAVSSPMGAPNCTRSAAYLAAARYAASAMPCACAAMAMRAPFMRLMT